jgi:mono/diheme cytochrome c family protein
MNRYCWICLAFLAFFPLAARAQQTTAQQPLNAEQKTGGKIFHQRCGVCHSVVSQAYPMYGPGLFKGLVEGNEDAIRKYIRDGSPKMPGFKYGLQASEIDAIVEYLKTVQKPPKRTAPTDVPTGPVD